MKLNIFLTVCLLFYLGNTRLKSQVGIGTNKPEGMLDIRSNIQGGDDHYGFVIPRVDLSQNNVTNPQGGDIAEGTIVFDLSSSYNCMRVYLGAAYGGWSACFGRKPIFRALSYYTDPQTSEEANRVGAGDFEKNTLFEVSDLPLANGNHPYTLQVKGFSAISGSFNIQNGKGRLPNPISPTQWNEVSNQQYPAIRLTIRLQGKDYKFTYAIPIEQYNIRSWQDLQGMNYDLNGDYTLMNDISLPNPSAGGSFPEELPEEGFDPIGESSDKFTGSFDGQNKTISNLFINRTYRGGVGLFGYIVESEIKNVNLQISTGGITGDGGTTGAIGGLVGSGRDSKIDNCHVTGGDVRGNHYVGGLAGYYVHYITAEISNSSAAVNVFANDDTGYIGGLVGMFGYLAVGEVNAITINNCKATGNVTGMNFIGGLVGYCKGIVTNSYSLGDVISVALGITDSGGGLIGAIYDGHIENCYATGEVIRVSPERGGLVGVGYATETYNYWDIVSSGKTQSPLGIGVSSGSNLIKTAVNTYIDTGNNNKEVFIGWDFSNTWEWKRDGEWPILQWE